MHKWLEDLSLWFIYFVTQNLWLTFPTRGRMCVWTTVRHYFDDKMIWFLMGEPLYRECGPLFPLTRILEYYHIDQVFRIVSVSIWLVEDVNQFCLYIRERERERASLGCGTRMLNYLIHVHVNYGYQKPYSYVWISHFHLVHLFQRLE